MDTESIVTSLDISIQLKEIGIKQISMFHWVEFKKENQLYKTVWEAKQLSNTLASAFTVEEIFRLLPDSFMKDESRTHVVMKDEVMQECTFTIPHRYGLRISYLKNVENGYWYCTALGQGYDNFGLMISECSFSEHSKTAADAAAKMLIHLIKEGLMKNDVDKN